MPRTRQAAARLVVASAILAPFALSGEAALQRLAAAADVRVQLLDYRNGLYALYGAGGNALILERDKDVVLMDAKNRGAGVAIRQAVQAITDKPITTAIVTHAHPDHAGGLAELKEIARIIVHERAADEFRRVAGTSDSGAGAVRVVQDRLTLSEGGQHIEVYYLGPGHTAGDLVVVFPESKIAYLGDLFPAKAAPTIDVEHGGSGVRFPETLARAIATLKAHDIRRISPGHDQGFVPPRLSDDYDLDAIDAVLATAAAERLGTDGGRSLS